MKEKSIFLLFTHSGSLLSKAIKLVTNEEFSHVSIAFDRNLNDVYSFGRKKPKNPFIAGFVKEDIYCGTLSNFRNVPCKLYEIKVSTTQFEKLRSEIDEYYKDKDRFRYNFLGLLTAWAGRPLHRKNAFFCSQFIAYLFEKAEIHILNKNPGLITPMEILSEIEQKSTLIYKGSISNFKEKEFMWHDNRNCNNKSL